MWNFHKGQTRVYMHSLKLLTLNEMYKKVVQTTAKKCTKKVCCMCKVAFSLIRPIVVFTVLQRCLSCLALHDFLFEQTIKLILSRSSLLALAKSILFFLFFIFIFISIINIFIV